MGRKFEAVSKYREEEIKMPYRSTKFSAGYDIFNNTNERIIVRPGEISKAITTKLKASMQIYEYLALHVRGSQGFKYTTQLVNCTGIIDKDYYNNETNEGEIFVKFINHGNEPMIIEHGEPICQGIFQQYLLTDDDNDSSSKRKGGFGSTDKK